MKYRTNITTSNRKFNLKNSKNTMGVIAEVEEQALPSSVNYDGEPCDLTHVGGHTEMDIKEIHFSDVEGPNNKDQGFAIVMQDAVGNKRVGRISKVQLKRTLREMGWDIRSY